MTNRLNNEEALTLGCLLGKKLSLDLDAGDCSSLEVIGFLLKDFPTEIISLVMSRYVQLERVVYHSLDETEPFKSILEKVNKEIREIKAYE